VFLNSKKKREAKKHAEIESQLRDACSEEPPSLAKIKAIAEQYPEAVKANDEDGERPLHIVCWKGGSLEVVEYLHHAWPWGLRAKTNREWIPLHFACFGNAKLEVIQYLVQSWRDSIKAQDNRERLPLHLACFRGASLEVIQYLVEVFPHALKLKDNGGSLPVHLACDNKAPLEVVKWLVDQWPESLCEVNNYGSIALHRACFSGAPPEVIHYLVQQWPESIKRTTNDGDLPLHLACGSGAPMEIVECLVKEWPSSVEQKDNEGKTPVDMAKQPFTFYKPSPQVVTYLESVGKISSARTTMPQRNTTSAPVVKETAVEKALSPKPEKAPSPTTPSPTTPSPKTPTSAMPFEKERIKIQEVVAGERDKPVSVPTKYVESIMGNQVLGKGFFGVVKIGKDDAIKQEFAIKTIDRELLLGGAKDDLERIKKDFKREQKALLHARHPNIAMLYAYAISDSTRKGHHLLYELAEKGSLDTFWDNELGRERLSSFRQRAQIALNVFIGLRFLHVGNKHVQPSFHRDIKSGNIVLKRDMTAQLIDCGLATFVHDGSQATSTGVKGTRGYVCPKYCTGSISFKASCDVFSFGVVLAELWSGRLQNHRDPEGKVYNFYEAYIDDEERKMEDDLDKAMGFGVSSELAMYMNDFKDLALACMARSPNKRPKGAEVMNRLERIWQGSKQIELEDMSDNGSKIEEESFIFNESLQLVSQFEDATVDEYTCPRCRTYANEVGEDFCPLCSALQHERFRISKAVSSNLKAQPTGAPLKNSLHSLRSENRSLHHIKHGKHDKNMPLVSHLDLRLDNQIPRLFVIVPADLKNGWKHPKVWLRRRVATKYNLYFICAQTYKMARPPIKLVVSKTWVDKIAPVLGVSLTLLQMAARKGININLHLGNAAAAMMDLNSAQLNEMLSEASTAMLKVHSELELNVERLSEMLGEVKLILEEQDERDGHDMMDRIRSGTKLSDRDLDKLNGETFELIVEKAREDRGWRMGMEPVRKKGDTTIVWVSRGAACDRKNEYEIVDVSASSVQDTRRVRDSSLSGSF
jgi:serine/threonine protein kinase